MFQTFLTLLARYGPTRILWMLLLAVPVWCLRVALPMSWAQIAEAAQGASLTPAAFDGLEVLALMSLLLVGCALFAHACLSAPGLGALGQRSYRRREVAAVMLPAAGLACCHFVWQAMLLGILAQVGVMTGLLSAALGDLLILVGMAVLLQSAASTLLGEIGEFLKRRGAQVLAQPGPLSRRTHRALGAFVLTPLAGLYLLASGIVQGFVEMEALGGLGTGAAFALIALIEALVLVVWLTANVVVWHRHRGHEPLAVGGDVAGIFG